MAETPKASPVVFDFFIYMLFLFSGHVLIDPDRFNAGKIYNYQTGLFAYLHCAVQTGEFLR